jgi:hypothetical protein
VKDTYASMKVIEMVDLGGARNNAKMSAGLKKKAIK